MRRLVVSAVVAGVLALAVPAAAQQADPEDGCGSTATCTLTAAGIGYGFTWEAVPDRPVGPFADWLLVAPMDAPADVRVQFCLRPGCEGGVVDQGGVTTSDYTESEPYERLYSFAYARNSPDPSQHVRHVVVSVPRLDQDGVDRVPVATWSVPYVPEQQTAGAFDGDSSAHDLAGRAGKAYGGAVAVGALLGLGLCLFSAMRG